MLTYIIMSLIFFILGFVFCAFTLNYWIKKKKLTEDQLERLKHLIQDEYIEMEDKVEKIIEIIRS